MNQQHAKFRRVIRREGPRGSYQLQQRFNLSPQRANIILREMLVLGLIKKNKPYNDPTYSYVPPKKAAESVGAWLTGAVVRI